MVNQSPRHRLIPPTNIQNVSHEADPWLGISFWQAITFWPQLLFGAQSSGTAPHPLEASPQPGPLPDAPPPVPQPPSQPRQEVPFGQPQGIPALLAGDGQFRAGRQCSSGNHVGALQRCVREVFGEEPAWPRRFGTVARLPSDMELNLYPILQLSNQGRICPIQSYTVFVASMMFLKRFSCSICRNYLPILDIVAPQAECPDGVI